jgi:hypothetical protein
MEPLIIEASMEEKSVPIVVKTENAQIAFYWFSLFLAQNISDCS